MSVHEAISAVPVAGTPQRDELQDLLVNRMIYFLGAAEDPTAFDPTTPNGAIVKVIAFDGKLFWYDSTDGSTAHDGTSTLVTAGGERFKIEGADFLVRRVLDKDLTAPPGSESIGDAYIVGASATGAWATHDDEIAIYTARGYEFLTPVAGWVVQVADEDLHYRLKENGSWVTFGVPADDTVTSDMIIGDRTHWTVENQTTNTPPSSAQGTQYIIGSSPTGDWTGHSGKIAVREASGTGTSYTILTPGEGWTAYDKAANVTYVYDGSAWVTAGGAIVAFPAPTITDGTGSTSTGGSGSYTWSTSTPPTLSSAYFKDDVGITHTAKKANAWLRIRYRARETGGGPQFVGALFRGSETNAIRWTQVQLSQTSGPAAGEIDVEFLVQAPDTSEYTYTVAFISDTSGGKPTGLSMRQMTIEELAA